MSVRAAAPEGRNEIFALPTYDLGPGRDGDELLVNLLVYGMLAALVLSVLWVLLPFAQDVIDRRRRR